MNDDLLVVPHAWPVAFCEQLRRAFDKGDAGAAAIVEAGPLIDQTVRRALDITPAPHVLARIEQALEHLRPRVAAFFGEPLDGDPVGVTCLRYGPGGHYLRHRDVDPTPGSGTEHRLVSVIVWLNSATTASTPGDFDGGSLLLYGPGSETVTEVIPTAGTLVAFPAIWSHEVQPVIRGTRDVVVDWWA